MANTGQKARGGLGRWLRYQFDKSMKVIVEIFARKKKSQAPRRRVDAVELLNNWTTRDWADLPVHHPRQD